ncbi:MAG: hypothetical protein WCJ39_10200, partial [bacterium]
MHHSPPSLASSTQSGKVPSLNLYTSSYTSLTLVPYVFNFSASLGLSFINSSKLFAAFSVEFNVPPASAQVHSFFDRGRLPLSNRLAMNHTPVTIPAYFKNLPN